MTKIAKGRQGDLFEEARGGVLRNEFKDTMARISAANRWAVYKIVQQQLLARFAKHTHPHRRIAARHFLRSVGNQVRKCGNSGDYASCRPLDKLLRLRANTYRAKTPLM